MRMTGLRHHRGPRQRRELTKFSNPMANDICSPRTVACRIVMRPEMGSTLMEPPWIATPLTKMPGLRLACRRRRAQWSRNASSKGFERSRFEVKAREGSILTLLARASSGSVVLFGVSGWEVDRGVVKIHTERWLEGALVACGGVAMV